MTGVGGEMVAADGPRVRFADVTDAAALLALKQQLDRETKFMLLEPDERDDSIAGVAGDLLSLTGRSSGVVIVADSPAGLVGYAEARVGRFRRAAITAHVVIGVLAAGSGRGVGSRLLGELELWAAEHGIHRLELTVMAHNQRARELYERLGYEAEGRRRECLIVDGLLVDEIYMAKLLTTGQPS